MNKRTFKVAGVALVAASLAFAGCGARTDAGTGGTTTKVVKIAALSPQSGKLSALGLGIRNSVDLAIRQANETNAVPGWKIELVAMDDEGKADVGKLAAAKLASDDQVIGVVGALNSDVSLSVTPVLAPANIVQVSPANTGPSLTKGKEFATNPVRPYANFFRTCTTDVIQGSVAAQYLLDSGIKSIATIHDKKIYGQGLVDSVTENFKKGGGTVVAAETVNVDDNDFNSVITKVKAANPEVVYYGGEYPIAGPLSKQMKAAGLKVPLMGGDGIFSGEFIKLGGTDGDLGTSVGEPIETSASGKAFVEAYAKAGFADGYEAYGAQSYDAANAIIAALKTSLAGASDVKSAREATVKAISSVSLSGATGKVSFDEFGDTVTKIVTVYKVADTKWVAVKTIDQSAK